MTSTDPPAHPPVRQLTVRGRVQGVGFRWFVRERARRLGVAGWVRNEGDGSVRIVVGGPQTLVSRFVDEIRRGPPNAVVDSIADTEVTPPEPRVEGAVANGAALQPALPYPFEIRR